ncbi:acyl carrier protein [Devosia sp. A16]|uniref:acyl carrier protein n=1 Tax=Devosia sp. A16 TaxID=1736675 RepID=UPI0006D8537D|nr:acyl carrier protein [Devosia sp. A16]
MTAELRATRLVAQALDIQGSVMASDDMNSLAAWSSLGHARLVLELEAELGRQLSGEEVAGITSVAAVARLLA